MLASARDRRQLTQVQNGRTRQRDGEQPAARQKLCLKSVAGFAELMNSDTHKTIASRRTTQRPHWFLVGLVIALIHAPLLTKPFVDSDEAVYASIAALTNGGGHLYAEGGVDNKFPGIFWIYAGVFRVFGQYAMNAVHVLTIVVVLATCAVLGAIAYRIGSKSGATTVALFYGVATTLYTPKMLAANTEIFAMLPVSAAVLLSLPRDSSRRPRREASRIRRSSSLWSDRRRR